MSLSLLQEIWFCLIVLLIAGYAVLDGFDLGAGFWHLFTKEERERSAIIKVIGPFWDGNEVWLLTGGGAMFAAFPAVYASAFSGFYLAMMLVLLGLIFRAVAMEFRGKVEAAGWKSTWDIAFGVGSSLPALLFGVAVGNVVRGLALDPAGNYIGSFFELLNPYALLIGLTSLTMFATHGALFLVVKCGGNLMEKARGWAQRSLLLFAPLYVIAALWSLFAYGRPLAVASWILALLAAISITVTRSFSRAQKDVMAFVCSSVTIILMCTATAAQMFPTLVPASNNDALSLNIYNSSSSHLTLQVMLIIALIGMPIVIGYTTYIYRTFAGKLSN